MSLGLIFEGWVEKTQKGEECFSGRKWTASIVGIICTLKSKSSKSIMSNKINWCFAIVTDNIQGLIRFKYAIKILQSLQEGRNKPMT